MAEVKIVVSDPETGKSYQKDFSEDALSKISGKKIGEEVDGSLFILPSYKLVITGGSDRSGFPMRLGIHGSTRPKVLIAGGVGYNPKEDVRKRIRVRGERVDDDIAQLNTKVTHKGQRPINELWGIEEKKEVEEKKPADAKAEKTAEAKPGK